MVFTKTLIGERHVSGDHREVIYDLDITSYTNPGGEAVTANTFGLTRLDALSATGREILDMDFKYIGTAMRLIVISTGAELGNGVNGGVWRVIAKGK